MAHGAYQERGDFPDKRLGVRRLDFLSQLAAFSAALPAFDGQPAAPQTFDLGGQAVLYRFTLELGGRSVAITAASLPRRSFRAAIVEQPSRDTVRAVQTIGASSGATVAINGGRFNGAFAPDGLLIVDGKTVGTKRADWIGYLTIDRDGNASVTSKPHLAQAQYAIQGNPLIVEPGGKIGVVREDRQWLRRTVIAQSGDIILAIVTSQVSLFSLAYALIERPDAFYTNRIDAALNLSGAATTGFYARLQSGETVEVPSYWPNREVITFTRRGSSTA